eukprot:scaffold408737_cov32-Prasinocladus_malaysianus.AAC.1
MAARAEAAELEAGQLRMRLQAQGTLTETRTPGPVAPSASPASRYYYASHKSYRKYIPKHLMVCTIVPCDLKGVPPHEGYIAFGSLPFFYNGRRRT